MLSSAGLGLRPPSSNEDKQRTGLTATDGFNRNGAASHLTPTSGAMSTTFHPPLAAGYSTKKIRGSKGPSAFALVRFMLPHEEQAPSKASSAASTGDRSSAAPGVSAEAGNHDVCGGGADGSGLERGDLVVFSVICRRGPRHGAGYHKAGNQWTYRAEKVSLVRRRGLPCR